MSLKNSYRRRRVSLVVLAFVLPAALAGTPSAIARPAASASPGDGQTLGGLTSQNWPVVVKISRNGKRIAMIRDAVDLTCTSGVDLTLPDGWRNVPIGPGGAVSASTNVPPSPSAGSGTSLTGGRDTLTGRINRTRGTFSGVWQIELTFSLSNGQTDDCKSGAVTFTAVP
jgi:hypothetical protein